MQAAFNVKPPLSCESTLVEIRRPQSYSESPAIHFWQSNDVLTSKPNDQSNKVYYTYTIIGLSDQFLF